MGLWADRCFVNAVLQHAQLELAKCLRDPDGAVAMTGHNIAACAVSTTKLADGAVTSARIAADAVVIDTTEKPIGAVVDRVMDLGTETVRQG